MNFSRIKNICFLMGSYPTSKNPTNTFVDELISEIADQGVKCSVITPQSISKYFVRKVPLTDTFKVKLTKKGNEIKIYSPKYFSCSESIFNFNTLLLSQRNFKKIVLKEYVKRKINADAFYGHFVNPYGFMAVEMGIRLKRPSFIACGESSLDGLATNMDYLDYIFKNVNAVIAVSQKNKTELINMTDKSYADKMRIFPNAINNKKFYQKDKATMRKNLGFDEKSFIVAFTGHFINRKGSLRLSEALDNIGDVSSIFIGRGDENPNCRNILFKGILPHEDVCTYLNAADVFVLPTLAEGCCNAIIEAMACGLPIISSDRPFNDDILNDENSIRVDPESIEQIQNAIISIRDNHELRESMSRASLKIAERLDIKQRASDILEFMNSKVGY